MAFLGGCREGADERTQLGLKCIRTLAAINAINRLPEAKPVNDRFIAETKESGTRAGLSSVEMARLVAKSKADGGSAAQAVLQTENWAAIDPFYRGLLADFDQCGALIRD